MAIPQKQPKSSLHVLIESEWFPGMLARAIASTKASCRRQGWTAARDRINRKGAFQTTLRTLLHPRGCLPNDVRRLLRVWSDVGATNGSTTALSCFEHQALHEALRMAAQIEVPADEAGSLRQEVDALWRSARVAQASANDVAAVVDRAAQISLSITELVLGEVG